MDPREALRTPLRLRRLPPRPGGGGRRRAGRPRRARRDADRRRQVALLPAAGADARRPHDRRLAARLADAGPGRRRCGAIAPERGRARQRAAERRREPRGAASARPPASCGCCTSRPERFASPGFLEQVERRRHRAVRRRRGALRLAVGPRLPPRLLPPRRRRALPEGARDRGADGDRDAAGRARHRRAPAAGASRCRSRPASTGPTSPSRSCRAGRRPTSTAASRRCWASRARCRRSSTPARATAARSWR